MAPDQKRERFIKLLADHEDPIGDILFGDTVLENDIREMLGDLNKPRTGTVAGFVEAIKKVDPKAEFLETGAPGEVVVFIEPNKYRALTEALYHEKAIGILVKCLPRPEFLADPEFAHGTRWWNQGNI